MHESTGYRVRRHAQRLVDAGQCAADGAAGSISTV